MTTAPGVTAPNLTAYAVRGDDGRIRVAVIEKDDTSAAPVSVAVKIDGGRAPAQASVTHLTGASLASAQGVEIQGASVNRAGDLPRRPGDPVRVNHGTVRLSVPSGSADLVVLRVLGNAGR